MPLLIAIIQMIEDKQSLFISWDMYSKILLRRLKDWKILSWRGEEERVWKILEIYKVAVLVGVCRHLAGNLSRHSALAWERRRGAGSPMNSLNCFTAASVVGGR